MRVNVIREVVQWGLLLCLITRDWMLCIWPFWHLRGGTGCAEPYMVPDQMMTFQLGLLQATVVCIGIGLTGAGFLGFKNMQEAAKDGAVAAAREKAEEVAQHYLAEKDAEAAKEKAGTQPHPSNPDEPNPFTLSPRK